MVWASQVPVDDSVPGIDTVRAKPLKKRCGSRAGLSRYYSSKSQSFSSLDLVQCTPFGNSALALAKRPSSFDLRRGSLRVGGGLSQATSSGIRSAYDGQEEEACMSTAAEVDDCLAEDGAGQCPCNDTIFADPGEAEAFMSPEGSPSASPLQLYDSYCLSTAGMGTSYNEQRQLQLTTEYLTHLSALLPMQDTFSVGGGCSGGDSGRCSLSTALSGSYCSSSSCGSGSCCYSRTSCASCAMSGRAASGGNNAAVAVAPWARQPAAAQHLSSPVSSYSAGGGLVRVPGGGDGAPCGYVSDAPAADRVALQCCGQGTVGAGSWQPSQPPAFLGLGMSTGGGLTGLYGSRPRSCMSAGGCLTASDTSGTAAGPAAASDRGGSCSARTLAVSTCAGGGGGGGGSGPRRIAVAHRRTRGVQASSLGAVHSIRRAAAGSWGSTEDMIASLTLSDTQQHQPCPSSLSRRIGVQPAPTRAAGVPCPSAARSGSCNSGSGPRPGSGSGDHRCGAGFPVRRAGCGPPGDQGPLRCQDQHNQQQHRQQQLQQQRQEQLQQQQQQGPLPPVDTDDFGAGHPDAPPVACFDMARAGAVASGPLPGTAAPSAAMAVVFCRTSGAAGPASGAACADHPQTSRHPQQCSLHPSPPVQLQLQQLPSQPLQWLCGSAPPASAPFGRVGGAGCY